MQGRILQGGKVYGEKQRCEDIFSKISRKAVMGSFCLAASSDR
jgi:hypothetical protein